MTNPRVRAPRARPDPRSPPLSENDTKAPDTKTVGEMSTPAHSDHLATDQRDRSARENPDASHPHSGAQVQPETWHNIQIATHRVHSSTNPDTCATAQPVRPHFPESPDLWAHAKPRADRPDHHTPRAPTTPNYPATRRLPRQTPYSTSHRQADAPCPSSHRQPTDQSHHHPSPKKQTAAHRAPNKPVQFSRLPATPSQATHDHRQPI